MGTIRKRGDKGKTWEARIARRGHKPLYGYFSTKANAERWIRETESTLEKTGIVQDYSLAKNVFLADVLEQYKNEAAANHRSKKKEFSRINMLKEQLGAYSLFALNDEEVVKYCLQRMDRDGVVSDTIRRELTTLKSAIDHALIEKKILLPANPVVMAKTRLTKRRKLESGVRRDRRPSDDEQRLLFAYPDQDVASLMKWATYSCMRREEIVNMKYEHRRGDMWHIPMSKSGESRNIRCFPELVAVLDTIGPGRTAGPVWPWTHADTLSDRFMHCCTALGIKDLRFHDLRHHGISLLFELRGFDIQAAAMVSGHKQWSTLQRYTHLREQYLRKHTFKPLSGA